MTNPTVDPTKTQFTRLRNVDCPYCGIPLQRANRTRDHLIGMNFVPPGAFVGDWNLVVGACKECNNEKSGLEDDISAITLLAVTTGTPAKVSPETRRRAYEKAVKSRSRLTAKTVLDSSESINLSSSRDGATFSFDFVSPPRIRPERSARLAWMQLRGFLYFIAYDEITRTSAPGPADLVLIGEVSRSDWGNVSQLAFAKHVAKWDSRLVASTAAGYFRVAIRREPARVCWSWALEWNKQWRLVGFLGDPDPVKANEQILPHPKRIFLGELPGGGFRTYLKEIALAEEDDILFG